MSRLLLACFLAVTALAQTPAATESSSGGASVSGTVVNDHTGVALRRAHIVLRPVQSGLNSVGVDTDDKGAFEFHDVEPGRYSISASRDGYLTTSICLIGTVRLAQTFTVHSKETVNGLSFRLRPFAVMTGRITYEDGEPAMNIRVEAYREYRVHLRHGYLLAGSAATNDRGEYRMFGLQPGSYIVAAVFERAAPPNETVRQRQELRYTTTFYTNSSRLSEAVPVTLDYGQETGGIDVTLVRVRKVRVRGRVLSGISGETVSATIALQRLDANNTASLPVSVAATFDTNHRFDLEDITPGAYVIWAESAEGGRTLVGHQPLTVGEADIDNVELTIQGDHPGAAVLVVDGGVKLEESIHLRFEPRNERGKLVEVPEEPGGEFHFSLLGDDHYDPFVTNLPNDFFLSAVRVNGVDTLPLGIDGVAASTSRPFELVIDSRGGRVSGRVIGPDDSLWSRASVALIPDPARGRVQSYREGAADENGLFLLRGVPPGKYILVAWLDEPPCDYYNPDGLNNCRATGVAVEVQQAGEQNVELKMKAPPRQ